LLEDYHLLHHLEYLEADLQEVYFLPLRMNYFVHQHQNHHYLVNRHLHLQMLLLKKLNYYLLNYYFHQLQQLQKLDQRPQLIQ
jgi:hypothetical protein